MEIKLDMMQTVALAVAIYYLGSWVTNRVEVLRRFCIPAPVVGGLIFAVVNLLLRQSGVVKIALDTTLQKPFMMVFFTTIGLGASLELVKKGGIQIVVFTLISTLLCIFQNGLGVFLAKALNQNPLLGIIAGSITLVGGHGTAGAFAPSFETTYGFTGATTYAMAAATFGLVMGSLIGGPIAIRLIKSKNLKSTASSYTSENFTTDTVEENVNTSEVFRTLTIVLISIGLGAILEKQFIKMGITLPSYVNSMIIAAIILNIGQSTKKLHINQSCTEAIGEISLNVFLSLALISLKLWELVAVAGPLLIILLAQTVLMAAFAYFITFNTLGRDYDAAVISAGQCGFGMGSTSNGIANMRTLTEKYGDSPRAFFVVPVVGAFLIDFINAITITWFANFFSK